MSPPPKTVRFSELVKKSGRPHPVTLWTDPKKDPELQQAILEGRVLTVQQSGHGSKTDFGLVGFRPELNGSYFIFSKSLSPFKESRIVGIKYDLVETPPVKDPAPVKRPDVKKNVSQVATSSPIPKPEPKIIELPKFKVQIECIATADFEVTARNSADAKRQALETAKSKSPENANVTYRMKRISKVSKP